MKTTKTQSVKGFKGFDKNLKCRDYQFEIGKTFIHNGKVKACSSGFHFCENPIDVLHYYNAGNSRFCEVEGSGEVSKDGSDSKVAVSELHISAEITLGALVKMGDKFIFDKVRYKNIDKATSGYNSTAVTSGYSSTAIVEGFDSVAVSTGRDGRARGVKGCWIVLVERDALGNILSVQSFKVDGEKVKENALYTLKNGELEEVK